MVEVPALNYLMIDGHGDPNSAQEYKDALETIYPAAYKLRFGSKAENQDYVVPPLEGCGGQKIWLAFQQAKKLIGIGH